MKFIHLALMVTLCTLTQAAQEDEPVKDFKMTTTFINDVKEIHELQKRQSALRKQKIAVWEPVRANPTPQGFQETAGAVKQLENEILEISQKIVEKRNQLRHKAPAEGGLAKFKEGYCKTEKHTPRQNRTHKRSRAYSTNNAKQVRKLSQKCKTCGEMWLEQYVKMAGVETITFDETTNEVFYGVTDAKKAFRTKFSLLEYIGENGCAGNRSFGNDRLDRKTTKPEAGKRGAEIAQEIAQKMKKKPKRTNSPAKKVCTDEITQTRALRKTKEQKSEEKEAENDVQSVASQEDYNIMKDTKNKIQRTEGEKEWYFYINMDGRNMYICPVAKTISPNEPKWVVTRMTAKNYRCKNLETGEIKWKVEPLAKYKDLVEFTYEN